MTHVDFGFIKNELSDADYMHVMQVLVRKSLYHGVGNIPATVILTDNALYFGGTENDGKKFRRIPLNSINSTSKRGWFLWECIEIRHMGLEGEERFFICPFKGSHMAPKKDVDAMDLLLSILNP
ncbi:MAG: hypothetical protein KKD39_01685 [Candidatus Altiarchaeota archaeon]|nr:hypothetical protein [Candidatus Altiarchaeota archaeon]